MIRFIESSVASFERILPHVSVSAWTELPKSDPGAVWDSPSRTAIRISLTIGTSKYSRTLRALIKRRSLPIAGSGTKQTLDEREFQVCKAIVSRFSEIVKEADDLGDLSLSALVDSFDEGVVAKALMAQHDFHSLSITSIFEVLRKLSEQTYENKALTFGCIIVPIGRKATSGAPFPKTFVESKKFRALSDGYRTAYEVSDGGELLDFVDLEKSPNKSNPKHHYYPEWAESISRASSNDRCGIALSRQGDILVFDNGALRFTYRYGRWQYWNHSYLVALLHDRARAQHVPPKILGKVIGTLYRAALDVSFRRSGGLFVMLHNRNYIRKLVRNGDAIGDKKRSPADQVFGKIVASRKIQGLRRPVIVELASLDGAVIIENSGTIRAYGAVLQPKKRGRLTGIAEGSRTKAAIGASHYGLAIKISSDGAITVYHEGRLFIEI